MSVWYVAVRVTSTDSENLEECVAYRKCYVSVMLCKCSLSLFRPGSGLGCPSGSDGKKKKNLPAKWETWIHSLGQEDPLEKGMATHSTILAWVIPRTGEPGGGCRVGDDSVTNTFTFWTR